jgi:cytochrome b561
MSRKPHRSPKSGYSAVQIVLHWATAGLILLQLAVNADIRRAFRARLAETDVSVPGGAVLHVAAGLAVVAFVAWRIGLRLRHGPPSAPEGVPPLISGAAEWAHRGLYALLLFTGLTGALAWFGRSEISASLHELGRLGLVALILVHILGALVEHYVLANRVIRRMIRPARPAVISDQGQARPRRAATATAPRAQAPSP